MAEYRTWTLFHIQAFLFCFVVIFLLLFVLSQIRNLKHSILATNEQAEQQIDPILYSYVLFCRKRYIEAIFFNSKDHSDKILSILKAFLLICCVFDQIILVQLY
jgi:hypothetical protein